MSKTTNRAAAQSEQNAQPDAYPDDLAGELADRPEPAPADLIEAWRAFEEGERQLLEEGQPLFAAGSWRMARSLQQLLAEADAANPERDKRSDGGIGDTRHAARLSDHNPDGRGVVCARDFDVDGLDVPEAFERMRQAVLAGRLPQLEGGYLIHAARITSRDFRAWLAYEGDNPHVTHGHVSVAHDPERADSGRAWNVWTTARPAPARPAPTPARQDPPRPTPAPARAAADLRGRRSDLRGEEGAQGPRVAALQTWLRRTFPLYAGQLVPDGVWGPRTTAALREFARRSGVPSADGRNIGPQIARQLLRYGLRD